VRGIKHPRIASRSNLRERCSSPSPSSPLPSPPVPLLLLRFAIVPHLRGPRAESLFLIVRALRSRVFSHLPGASEGTRAADHVSSSHTRAHTWNTSERIDHGSTGGTSEERAFSRKERPRVERGSARKICAAVVYSRAFTEEQCNYRPVIRYTAEYEDRLVRGDRRGEKKGEVSRGRKSQLAEIRGTGSEGRAVGARARVYQRIGARH